MARGDARPDSDVDIAVEIEPGRSFSLIRMKDARLQALRGMEDDPVAYDRSDLRECWRNKCDRGAARQIETTLRAPLPAKPR